MDKNQDTFISLKLETTDGRIIYARVSFQTLAEAYFQSRELLFSQHQDENIALEIET